MDLSMECIELFLNEISVGIRSIHDPFFNDSHQVCNIFQRTGVTIEDDEELCHQVMKEFVCNAPGCKASFDSLLNFEIHYNSTHRYTCSECKKIKTNARLLEIHIQETHDNYFKIASTNKPMYQCYVSDCQLKFNNAEERRTHCVTVHKFSKHFKHGKSRKNKANEIKSTNSMDVDILECDNNKPQINLSKNQRMKMFDCHKQKNTTKPSSSAKVVVQPTIAATTSSLIFTPRQLNIKLQSKSLIKDQNNSANVLENNSMMELAEALPPS